MWAKLQDDPAEADRIEFVGDAVVRLVLSLEVYKRYPSEGPGLYTVRSLFRAKRDNDHGRNCLETRASTLFQPYILLPIRKAHTDRD